MSKNTGSDSGISENIELNLETNFESVLTRTTAFYTNFQKRVGSVSQSLVTNVNSMYKQVSTNLTAMTADVQNNTIRSINATRTGMRKIVDENMKASIDVKKNLDAMSQFRGMAERVAATGDEKKIAAFNTFMDKKAAKLEQQAYLELGKAAAGASETIKQASMDSLNSIEKLTTGTHKSFYKLRKDLWENGDIVSALRAKDGVIELENQLKVAEKTLLQQGKRVTAAEKEVQNARLALTKQTNNKLREEQEQFLQQTIVNLNKVQQEHAASEREVARLRGVFTAGKKAVASDIVGLVSNQKSAIVPNAAESIAELNAIKAKFAEMAETYNKLSKTRFLSRSSVSEFKNDAEQMQKRVAAYKESIEKLKESIRGLEILHKKGLAPGSGAEIENYKTILREMEAGLRNISTSSRKTMDESENLVRKQTKSVLLSTWEMVRNFRWQVAAIYYLATKAVAVVRNMFFGVLDEVQKFRTSSMAIAASITYSMIGDISKNFNTAFAYSTELMYKMEMEAAKTILTMEDMSMLVKTFTQAGIIPDTADDLKKIATVGTAIKILTEGMANAGVQMRQELYAIIQGRQRATDQVAMMFKMVGININEVLKKAKKEGKDMLDVLSEALAPFNEVNERMKDDYVVQLDSLQKIWEKIKRIGAENTYKEMSKNLKEINQSLADVDTGRLTEGGRKASFYVGMTLETLRLIGEELASVIMSISGAKNGTEAWLIVFRGLHGAIWAVSSLIKGLVAVFTDFAENTGGLFAIYAAAITGDFATVKRIAVDMWDNFGRNTKKAMEDATTGFDNIHLSAEALRETLKDTTKEFEGLQNKFKIPKPEASEAFDNLDKEIHQATLASKSGVEKANYEYKKAMDDLSDYKGQYLKKQAALVSALSSGKATAGEEKGLKTMLEGTKEKLKQISEYESALLAKKNKTITDSFSKQSDKLINLRAEYENLLESFEVTPQTPLEQVEKKYDKALIALNKFIDKNKKAFSDDELDKLRNSLTEGKAQEMKVANEEMQQAYQTFYDSMMSHKVMSPFEVIDNEFKKIQNNIEKANNLTVEQKQSLISLIPAIVEERKTLEMITLELEKQKALARERKSYADILNTSIAPNDKMQAELINLEATYTEAYTSIQGEIDKIRQEWEGRWDMPASEIIKIAAMKQELENLGILFEKHKKDIQEPFWKDLEDLSQGWADSLADTLTEVMWNMDSFEDAFKSFLEAILQDIVRSGIKRAITDNLLNMIPAIGNYFSGGSGVGASAAASTGTAYGAGALNYMSTGYGTGPFIGMAGGGVINEPVIGRGLRSGTSYAFGEGGASEVVLPLDKLKGNSSPSANVVVNVINQSGERMSATQQGKPRFDGEKFVVDVIMRKMSTDPAFRSAMGRR